jgi:hypothetical protein
VATEKLAFAEVVANEAGLVADWEETTYNQQTSTTLGQFGQSRLEGVGGGIRVKTICCKSAPVCMQGAHSKRPAKKEKRARMVGEWIEVLGVCSKLKLWTHRMIGNGGFGGGADGLREGGWGGGNAGGGGAVGGAGGGCCEHRYERKGGKRQ